MVKRVYRVIAGVSAAVAAFAGPVVTPSSSDVASAGAAAPAPAVAGASVFRPVVPTRLADTRTAIGYIRLDGATLRIPVTGRGGIPRSATAVVVTLTVADTPRAGYLTAYPSGGAPPQASNLNYGVNDTIANSAAVQIGANGSISVFSSVPGAAIIVDVAGYFEPASQAVAAGRYVPVAAQRVLDTRDPSFGRFAAGETRTLTLPTEVAPPTATAIVANLTYLDANAPGYFVAWPSGPRPDASTGNLDRRNQTRAHLAVIPTASIAGIQAINLYSSAGAHILVDVTGYFTGADAPESLDGMFVPSAPRRILDTRSGIAVSAGGSVLVPAGGGSAVWANLTSTGGTRSGYVTARPAFMPLPATSALNTSTGGQTIANSAVVNLSSLGAQLYSAGGEHLIVDLAGTFTGTPVEASCRSIVLAHGGSYTGGTPGDLAIWAARFRQAGWNVVNADYRVEPLYQSRVWGWWYPRTSVFQEVPDEMRSVHNMAVADLRPQIQRALLNGCVTHTFGYSSGGSAIADAASEIDGVASINVVASAILDLDHVGGPPMHVWHSSNDPIIGAVAAAESCPRWWAVGSSCTMHDLGEQPGAHISIELDTATAWLTTNG